MPVIVWSEKYNVGIPEIDAQHSEWVRLINEFYDGLGAPAAKLRTLLARAEDYTRFHFREEEALMRRLNYFKVKDQQAAHGRICAQITTFKERLEAGTLVASMEVTRELRSWFNEHILVEDKALGEHYRFCKAAVDAGLALNAPRPR